MGFSPNREQERNRKMDRALTGKEGKPIPAEIDRTHEFPAENIRKLFRLRVISMTAPREYGGAGSVQLSAAICAEERAKACASTSDIMAGHTPRCVPLLGHGTEEQKRRVPPKWTTGGVLRGKGFT